MSDLTRTENQAGLARITCGWKKSELPLDWVRKYWRDVHSPAITRRDGVYDYRHYQFDSVRPNVFPAIDGVEYHCPDGQHLMWLSDVRYKDEQGLAAFDVSPFGDIKAHLLGDIELIVDKSTTYKAIGENAFTYVDSTKDATPQGPVPSPTYALFIRQKSDEDSFRECLRKVAKKWSEISEVNRLRLSLFDVPDMEAERKAGYPVKTHPIEMQYQAWIDLTIENDKAAQTLISSLDTADVAAHVSTIHAYPVRVVYTSIYAGQPTLVGLRGYPAYEAITALGADNQKQSALLEWMYGPVARDGAVDGIKS
ncbi:MAG: hypothetical protein P8L79_11850 [Rhodospirillaceae bacterium]|jgi:hypothetical protein|nr:hypothetical protein [Rhodospirillaceae bacterium]